jgi:hypothetical protein
VIFLAVYDRYGMVPVSNVLTGPLFVTKDTEWRTGLKIRSG